MALPATDNFTGPTNDLLPVYNPSWTLVTGSSGSMRIVGSNSPGVLSLTAGTKAFYWNADVFNSAHYSKCQVQRATGAYFGPCVRVQSGANSFYYTFVQDDGVCFAGQQIAGTQTDWDLGQSGFVTGDVVELLIDPNVTTTVYLKKNGVIIATYTGKNALSGGAAGIDAINDASGTGWQGRSWEGGNSPATASGGTRNRMALLGVGR